MRQTTLVLAVLAALATVVPAAQAEETAQLTVTTSAFEHEGTIPIKFTCDGENVSPPIDIADVPAEAVELVLIMQDPDVPTPEAPQRTLTHWLVYNIDPANPTFPEAGVPAGALQGQSNQGQPEYRGPCPPALSNPHRYFFYFKALNAPSGLTQEGATLAELEAAIEGKVIAEGTLMGRYACFIVDCLSRDLPI
jgi:hypothetical protein